MHTDKSYQRVTGTHHNCMEASTCTCMSFLNIETFSVNFKKIGVHNLEQILSFVQWLFTVPSQIQK